MATGTTLLILASLPVVFYLLWQRQDADFTLLFLEKFGRSASKELDSKVVWVTGASGGIGEHLAYELAKHGAKLVLSGRRKHELERVKTKCIALAKTSSSQVNEKDVLVLPLDITKFDTHSELTLQAVKHFNRIDILVNNAGRFQVGKVVSTSLKVDQAVLDVNLLGVMSLTKAVLPYMIERKQGQIVVNGAGFGKFGAGNVAVYSASKFALHGYFNSLRIELLKHNIDVLIANPGPVISDLLKNSFTEEDNMTLGESSFFGKLLDHFKEAPMKVMGTTRCAHLMIVAMANRMEEVWLSSHPVLLNFYLSQYAPTLFSWQSKKLVLKFPLESDDN